MHLAVHAFKRELVELLVEAGACLELVDEGAAENALHKAVVSHDASMTALVLRVCALSVIAPIACSTLPRS